MLLKHMAAKHASANKQSACGVCGRVAEDQIKLGRSSKIVNNILFRIIQF